MDKADLTQPTPKDEPDLGVTSPNDATRAGARPTFLSQAHQCVSGIWGLLVVALTIV